MALGRCSADDARAIYARGISIDGLANPGAMNVPWPPKGPLTEAQRGVIAQSGLTAINAVVAAGSDTVDTAVATIALWTGAAELLTRRGHPSSVIEKVIEGNVHRAPTHVWSV